MGGNFSRTLTVLSDSINPVVRSTCGGFCALTTVNCAPRLRIVVDFFERDEKKGISVSKDVSFRVTHTDVLFPIRREKDRERERTNETYNSSFLHHTSAKKTTKRVFCRRRI